MYLGKIVELSNKSRLFENPAHPYTKALLSAIPIPDPKIKRERIILSGDVQSPTGTLTGCRFHPRCRHKQDICRVEEPSLEAIENGHLAACHLFRNSN
jgi:oligopeptide/dipeptide ABC transporter ATP-binding protein